MQFVINLRQLNALHIERKVPYRYLPAPTQHVAILLSCLLPIATSTVFVQPLPRYLPKLESNFILIIKLTTHDHQKVREMFQNQQLSHQ